MIYIHICIYMYHSCIHGCIDGRRRRGVARRASRGGRRTFRGCRLCPRFVMLCIAFHLYILGLMDWYKGTSLMRNNLPP